jgi:flavin-dependent dehydrogenase
VLERENFPREHVGESQLPPITQILNEMGAWEKVEAAGFPVKTGAMYRWGNTDDLWRFDFLVNEKYQPTQRPSRFQGQRTRTTFHVERGLYDQILLDHAQSLGTEVRQGTAVREVQKSGDRVTGLVLADGTLIEATYYVDASGHAGILRRNMQVEIVEPTPLKNVAFWDYWTNSDWAESVNKDGVRARIFSIGYGWVWYIPLSTTKSSIGFVTHADYFKSQGLRPSEIYDRALREEPFVRNLLGNAQAEGNVRSTKDWSFVADRLAGENWFLVGESAGFADPILAAGMTLAQVGARELAYALLALMAGEHDGAWLREWYSTLNRRRVMQHIRFADYWYSANAHFSDLKRYTSEIAREAGLDLEPEAGFRWLAAGGFASDDLQTPYAGSYQIGPAKILLQVLTGKATDWNVAKTNDWRLNLAGAKKVELPLCIEGRIKKVLSYQRESRLLPLTGIYRIVYSVLQRERDAGLVMQMIKQAMGIPPIPGLVPPPLILALEAIEGMIAEGWIRADVNKKRPMLRVAIEGDSIQLSESDDPYAMAAYSA